jgi:hypothetical protein
MSLLARKLAGAVMASVPFLYMTAPVPLENAAGSWAEAEKAHIAAKQNNAVLIMLITLAPSCFYAKSFDATN